MEDARGRVFQLETLQDASDGEIKAQQKTAALADAALTEAKAALFAAQLKEQQAEEALEEHKTAIL